MIYYIKNGKAMIIHLIDGFTKRYRYIKLVIFQIHIVIIKTKYKLN